jgi:hypothetical protein
MKPNVVIQSKIVRLCLPSIATKNKYDNNGNNTWGRDEEEAESTIDIPGAPLIRIIQPYPYTFTSYAKYRIWKLPEFVLSIGNLARTNFGWQQEVVVRVEWQPMNPLRNMKSSVWRMSTPKEKENRCTNLSNEHACHVHEWRVTKRRELIWSFSSVALDFGSTHSNTL